MNKPEKVTYRYINTETKKIDSITFRNFQKLFIENDMTWTNKSEFIYTIRTSTERNRIEQLTTKNFNQNAYLDKVDRENTFWLLQEEKVYRSLNWLYRYHTFFGHGVSRDDGILHYFEQIRRRGFKQEKRKERKLVYTTYGYFKTLTTEGKKAVALVAKGNKLMMRVVPGARFFVPETMYNQRRINFLKNATFVAKHDVRLILGFDFDEKLIYEFRLENILG